MTPEEEQAKRRIDHLRHVHWSVTSLKGLGVTREEIVVAVDNALGGQPFGYVAPKVDSDDLLPKSGRQPPQTKGLARELTISGDLKNEQPKPSPQNKNPRDSVSKHTKSSKNGNSEDNKELKQELSED